MCLGVGVGVGGEVRWGECGGGGGVRFWGEELKVMEKRRLERRGAKERGGVV